MRLYSTGHEYHVWLRTSSSGLPCSCTTRQLSFEASTLVGCSFSIGGDNTLTINKKTVDE
ncbi:hypothetical protein HI110_22450 [Escherichia fergusonii]|nr:hypothetical protein [Escherichia fergusonii]